MADQTDRTVNLDDLQADQQVYTSDGRRLGYVEGILDDVETGERFLEVSTRVLHNYYVPESAIKNAVIGRPVLLNVSHDEAVERFRNRPKAV